MASLITHRIDFTYRYNYLGFVDKLDSKILRTIEEFELLKRGDSVLVALSGGPDSVALLHILLRLKDKYALKLAAAHVDHGIRRNSVEDREFCRALCRNKRVRFYSKRTAVAEFARKRNKTLEEAGREIRYRYLESLADRYGYDRIATGHTSDDNAETVIFNLTRGSGLSGVAGIPARRSRIIRPLIEIRKPEIMRWLMAEGIGYRTDRSNRSIKYARNSIRLGIIPLLEKLNPAAVDNISRFSRHASEDLELIDSLSRSTLEKSVIRTGRGKIVLDSGRLKSYDNKLRKKVMIAAYLDLSDGHYGPSSNALSAALRIIEGRTGGRSRLGEGIWIEKSKKTVSIFKSGTEDGEVELKIPGMTEIPFSDVTMESEVLSRSQVRGLKTGLDHALLDRSSTGLLKVRGWRKGDRIRPLGMKGWRLLSDIFTDRGLPSIERRTIPLLHSGERIAWIAGIMISENFKVRPETREVLSVRMCAR